MVDISITPTNGAVATWAYQNVSYDPAINDFSNATPSPTSVQYNLESMIGKRMIGGIDVFTLDTQRVDVNIDADLKTVKLTDPNRLKACRIDLVFTDKSTFSHALGFDNTERTTTKLNGMERTTIVFDNSVKLTGAQTTSDRYLLV